MRVIAGAQRESGERREKRAGRARGGEREESGKWHLVRPAAPLRPLRLHPFRGDALAVVRKHLGLAGAASVRAEYRRDDAELIPSDDELLHVGRGVVVR